MINRLQPIRRLAMTSACWSGCAFASLWPTLPAAAADRFPKPKFTWSRNDSESRGSAKRVTPAGAEVRPGKNDKEDVDVAAAEQELPEARHGGFSDELSVKLNYLTAEWPKVLEELAESTGSTLVMLDTPPGRFSRQDRSKYSRKQAIQILNRELEPLGFRILEKDNFLTVLEVHRLRLEYPRPERKAQPQTAGVQQAAATKPTTSRAGHSVQPSDGVRQVVHQTAPPEEQPQQPVVEPEPSPVSEKFLPENRQALDLAKQIHAAFKSRSQLIDVGPTGLPGFQVRGDGDAESLEAGKILFEVELDTEKDELVLHGRPSIVGGVKKLIQRLDAARSGQAGEAMQFVPGDERLAAAAEQVRPTLAQLAQFRQGAQGAGRSAQEDQETPRPQRPGQANGPESAGVLDEIRGEVTIEYVEGVGLILIGNEADVEAVLRVVQSVEQMAVGSMPSIEIVNLQHVDSGSLATLLTSVYSELQTVRSRGQQTTTTANTGKQVSILSVGTPNALLVIAPPPMIDSVIDLASKLDQPVDAESELHVFHLKSAVASQVAEHLTTLYPEETTGTSTTTTTPGLRTTLRAVADVRTNSIIVQARPRNLSEITKVIEELDRDASASVIRGKRIQLKYTVPDDMALFLNQAIQGVISPPAQIQQQGGQFGGFGGFGGGQNQAPQELRDSKAVVLEFLMEDGNTQRLVRSGLLSDVRVTAEPHTNSLLITAPPQSLPLLESMISVLDVPGGTVADIKMFRLINADATAMADLLTNMFAPQQQQQNAGGGFGGANQNQGSLGIQIAGASDSSSALVALQFSPDVRTNTIIAKGGTEALIQVEAIIRKLDATDSRNRRIKVLRLRNTPAADIAGAIQTILQGTRDLATSTPDLITASQLLEQDILVQGEPVSNSLLISATPRYFDYIEQIAMELDREPDQVMIQAIICEVQLSGDCEFGVELGFQDPLLFDRSVNGAPGFLFNNNPLGNNTAVNPSSVGSQGLSNFALGRASSQAGFAGLVLSASSESVSVLIRALEAHSNVQVLSRPSVTALDNQIAEILVGQKVPRPNGVTVTQNIVSPNIQDTDVGILLSVIPRITPEGMVIMQLIADKSELSDISVPIFTDADSGNVVESPIINTSSAETTIKVPDGQTVVVGGMITSTDSTITRKVPWLGDLPVIGRAFRYDQQRNSRTELIVFLTPRIVRHDTDSELIKQVESQRLHFFEADVEAMHGPIFGVPAASGVIHEGMECPPGGEPTLMPLPGEIVPQDVTPTQATTVTPGAPAAGSSGQSIDGVKKLSVPPNTTIKRRLEATPLPAGPVGPVTMPSMPSGATLLPPPPQGKTGAQLGTSEASPLPPFDPATNSKQIKSEYGDWWGRRPIAH